MSKNIPKRIIDDIRFRNDIVDVVGSYFALQRNGQNFKATCPFHKEKTPSFHVNQQRQIFHCFGCGAGGDVFRFVMQHENVDFITAVRMLADKAGIKLETEDDPESGGVDKAQIYTVLYEVATFLQRCLQSLKSAGPAREYLQKRNLTGDTASEFMIGYAPNRWDTMEQFAAERKFKMESMELAGMVIPRNAESTPGGFYDRFRDRVMFPIHDEQARIIGFSGRCLVEGEKTAKYVNSPETAVFHKSRVLYALDKARRHMVDSREAIICEGQIDVIRCHQAGFKTAVASQGTAFTEDHAGVIRRYADSVLLVFDPDKAGQKASIKAASIFMKAGLAVRVASLPPKEDPDSFISKRGADAFKKVLDAAGSVVDFQVRVMADEHDIKTEVGTMRISRELLSTIAQTTNAILRAKLIQEAATRLGIPASALNDELKKVLRRAARQGAREEAAQEESAPAPTQRPADEVALCEHATRMADTPALADLLEQYLPLDMVSDATCRAVLSGALEAFRSAKDLQDVLREHDTGNGELQRFAASVQNAPSRVLGREYSQEEAVHDLILGLWRRRLQDERKGLERKGAEAPLKEQHRCHQIAHDLKALRSWSAGSAIIMMELAEHDGG